MSKRNPTPSTPKPSRSDAQDERTKTRGAGGRFSPLNPCELCGKSVGARYTSDARCNEFGRGVTLHGRCADVVSGMDADLFVAVLDAAAGALRAREMLERAKAVVAEATSKPLAPAPVRRLTVEIVRTGGYDPAVGRATVDPTLESDEGDR